MRRLLIAVQLLFLLALQGHGQSIPASTAASPAQITIESAVVPLTGPWKFHTGDNPQWASPDFDDSSWGTMDLGPTSGDPYTHDSGFVPGWTTRGYAGYSGYAWYRLQVVVTRQSGQDGNEPLAISMPARFENAYQVYVNGKLVGQMGRFTAQGVSFYANRPGAFSLPRELHPGATLTIAIRMWMDAYTALVVPEAGGLHGPPVLGQAGIIDALQRLHWYTIGQMEASEFFEIMVQLLAILVVFSLFWLDRGEKAYLWLGLSCTISLVYVAFMVVEVHTTWVRANSISGSLPFVVLAVVQKGVWLVFWAYWFRLEHRRDMVWLYRVAWATVLLLVIGASLLSSPIYGDIISARAVAWIESPLKILALLLGLMLVWIAYQGIRKNGAEGWIALPAVLLVAFSFNTQLLHIPRLFFVYGISIPLSRVATLTSLAIISVLMLRRFLQGQRQREQWKLEMEQAQHVQQLLIPAAPPLTPGFIVESVYLPAQQVGGDFFQVLPADDGSLLIVVGDVSGKGLKAAMTVSAIIGALRGCTLRKPSEVLAHLNRVLHGQITGFATCAAALIDPEGEVRLANAGNLAPYRNGEELPIDSGLPLGIVAESDYSETTYHLEPGDRLTFVSDGVVEATNQKKELFGFDRTQAISNQSATVIAAAAQEFGQSDDISVLSVTRKREAEWDALSRQAGAIQEA